MKSKMQLFLANWIRSSAPAIFRSALAVSGRWLLVLSAMASVGCASQLRRELATVLEKEAETSTIMYGGSMSKSSAQGPALDMTAKDLEPYLEVEHRKGALTVAGPREYRRSIHALALHGGETLEETKRELGIESHLEMHLVLVPIEPEQSPSQFDFEIEVVDHRLTNPLLIVPTEDHLTALLNSSGQADYDILTNGVAGHEFFEFSLVLGEGNMRIAPDAEVELDGFPFPVRVRNFTRWYRDGFATYAATVWLEKLYDRAGIEPEDRTEVFFLDNAEESLKRVGADVFRWSQFKRNRNQVRYEASLGLFLRLEEEFGRDQIRAWNESIAASTDGYKTRADLLRTAKEVFGVDLCTLVRQAKR